MSTLFATLAGLTLVAPSPAAHDPVSPEQIKQAVQRAVPYLLDPGDKGLKGHVSGRQCMSCHWSSAAVFALGTAQRRGFVDRQELKKFDPLLQKQSTRKTAYVLNDKLFALLKTEGLTDHQLRLLNQEPKQRWSTKDLLEVLGKQVAKETLEKHEAEIIKLTIDPNAYDTIGRLMSASILMSGIAQTTSTSDAVEAGLIEALLLLQLSDGSFRESVGQPYFPGVGNEQVECQTLWVVLALQSFEGKSEAVAKSLARANAYLRKVKPGQSLVTLLLRTLWAHRMKDAPGVAEFSTAFLKQQRADGGWGTWPATKEKPASDAWATGMALYTLGTIGRTPADPSVQRGLSYLLRTQESDGGWTGTNVRGKSAKIWTYWGTSWAVVGLLETLPK